MKKHIRRLGTSLLALAMAAQTVASPALAVLAVDGGNAAASKGTQGSVKEFTGTANLIQDTIREMLEKQGAQERKTPTPDAALVRPPAA